MVEPLWSQPRAPQDVGAFVAAVRRQSGRTQGELADAAGVPRRFVNELENGHVTQYAQRLAEVLRELGIRLVLDTGEPSPESGRLTGASRSPPKVKDLGW